jgi:hypothetical protein
MELTKGTTSRELVETSSTEGILHSRLYIHKVEGKKILVVVNGFAINYITGEADVILTNPKTAGIFIMTKKEFKNQFKLVGEK